MAATEATSLRVALGASLLALAGAAFALLRAGSLPAAAPQPEEASATVPGALASPERVDALERRLRALEERADLPRDASLTPTALAALERRVAALEQAPAAPAPAPDAPVAPLLPPAPPDANAGVEFLRASALDTRRTEAERVAALKGLRAVTGARTHEVVIAMVDLLRTSKDPKVREDVIKHLHGTKDPDLVQPMIEALLHDTDEEVRAKAADDIDDFVSDAQVVRALELAKDTDASQKVRKKAAKTLAATVR